MNQIIPDRSGVLEIAMHSPAPGNREVPPHAHSVSLSRDDGECKGLPLKPLHDRVLVRRTELPPSSPIIVPDVAKTKPLKGVVIAVGPGKKHSDGVFRETMVKPGDEVLFTASVDVPYADLVHEGDLVMMAEADILGILTIGSH